METLKKVDILEYTRYVKLENTPGDYISWKGHEKCTCERSTNISRKLDCDSLLLARTDGRKMPYRTDSTLKQ